MTGPHITYNNGKDRLWPFQNPGNNSHMKKLETAFRASLGLDGRLKDYRAQLDATRRFTPQGIDAEAAKFIKNDVLPGIVKGHIALAAAQRHVKQTWDQLKPKPVDKTDLVALFRRDRLMDKLQRQHPTKERRDEYLKRHADEISAQLALAVIEAAEEDLPGTPAEQRFVSEQTVTMLTRHLIAAEHDEAIANLEQIEQAINYASPTIEKGRVEIQANLAMNEVGWQQAVADEARKGPPIWLKKQDDGRVMVLSHGDINPMTKKPYIKGRAATEEELEVGVYYNDRDEWEAALAAAA